MNSVPSLTLNEALIAVEGYPYLRECFSEYLKWLFEKCDEKRRKYDVVFVKVSTGAASLGDLEKTFQGFGDILEINEVDFCKAFRFDVDRNKKEILKIEDLLVELWAAIALSNYGFTNIRKIPTSKSRMSDFTAYYDTLKFAVEVKNLRGPKIEDYYIWQTNALYEKRDVFLSDYFGNSQGQLHLREEELLNDGLLSLLGDETKRQKISEQLENAKKESSCHATMLVGCSDSTTILRELPEIIVDDLQKVVNKYLVSNYLGCCVHDKLFCSPQLP
jgi:hypothetical protein